MKFLDTIGNPSYLPTNLLNCLYHVSFRRYSPLSLKVVEKPNVKVSLRPIFRGTRTPIVLQHFVSAIYRPPLGKVWSSSACRPPSAKPGYEVESRIYVGWVKMQVQFEAVCGPKFSTFYTL